jgi:hypothetical protein
MCWRSVHEKSGKSTRPGSFTNRLHKLLDSKSVCWSDKEPALSEYDSRDGAEEESFSPSGWEMMLLYDKIFCIL